MEKKFIVTYMVPVTIKVTDHVKPNTDEVIAALVKTARQMIMNKDFYPVHIEEAYEIISEDKVGKNQILGVDIGWAETDNDVGTTGGKDSDNGESLPTNECGEVIGNNSGTASEVGNESKDRTEDEGRLQQDQTQ